MLLVGDCLDYMKSFKTNQFDILFTDPPYGIGIAKWDIIPSDEYFKEMFRISKNQIIFGGNYFNLPHTESWIIWYKQPFLKNQAQAEMIWTSFKFKTKVVHYRYAGNCEGYPDNMKVDYKKKSTHPTEKPVEVLRNIISTYTKKTDTIIDPFAGTGNLAIACQMEDREYTLIEREPEYVKIIQSKI